MFDTAIFTEGFAGIADGTTVENDAVAEGRRGLGRENFAKLPLDFFRLLQVIHQAEAVGDADTVGIHHGAASPRIRLAVLRPTPGRAVSSSIVEGT